MPERITRLPIALAIQLALASLAPSAMAQNTSDETEKTLSTVTVTASADASAEGLSKPYAGGQVATGARVGFLGTQNIMDTPFSTTSYTNELIQDRHAHSVGDVLQNDPGVRVARGYGNFQESYFIRGFVLSSDEVAYNGLYGLLPRQYVSAELFERVEVLRGANAFLNGAAPAGGGIGGSINLLPKRAPEEDLNRITAGVSSGGQLYNAADLARRFGENKEHGLRLNAVRRSGDTAVDNEKQDVSLVSLGYDWRGDHVRLSADIGHQEFSLESPRPSVTLGSSLTAVPAAPSGSSNFAQPWSYSKERDTFGAFRGEVDLTDNITAWAAFGARETDEDNSLANPTVTNAATGAATTYRADNRRHDSVISGEAGVRGKFETAGIKHTLAATASTYQLEAKNSYQWSTLAALSTNIYNFTSAARPSSIGYYGGVLESPGLTRKEQFTSFALSDTLVMFNDSILLTLGARQQNIHTRSYTYNNGALSSEYDKSKLTPAAGIVFKPLKNLSLYANYIESLAAGGTAGSTALNAGTILAPYVAKQKEIGAKYDAGNLGAGIALFTTSKPSGYLDSTTNLFGAYGEDRHRGMELSVYGEALRGLRLLGGLTLLDAEQRNTKGGATDGKKVIGVPSAQGNLGVEWDIPGTTGVSADVRMVSTGSSYANAANTLKVPGWTRFDVGARYITDIAGKMVTLRARVDNVFNKDYWASVGGYPGYGYLVAGNARTYSLTATMDF
ncbi:MAG: TonB-dependent receptor [Proteobacteria bacterium]|nr:TonB-dependent receptor [Pseudomonadota bacterium]